MPKHKTKMSPKSTYSGKTPSKDGTKPKAAAATSDKEKASVFGSGMNFVHRESGGGSGGSSKLKGAEVIKKSIKGTFVKPVMKKPSAALAVTTMPIEYTINLSNDNEDEIEKPPSPPPSAATTASTKSKKHNKKNKKQDSPITNNQQTATPQPTTQQQPKKQLTKIQQTLTAKLSGSRFRSLNETLYTSTSQSSLQTFSSNGGEEMFLQYHEGFREQVKGWEVNPVDLCLDWVNKVYGGKAWKFEKQRSQGKGGNEVVVGDFGCGDGVLGLTLTGYLPFPSSFLANTAEAAAAAAAAATILKTDTDTQPPLRGKGYKIHSFDLIAPAHLKHVITSCDSANVPIGDGVLDAAVFCLSLMGTNISDFVKEAFRTLKPSGKLRIIEVKSRFESSVVSHTGRDHGRSDMVDNNSKQARPKGFKDNKKTGACSGGSDKKGTPFSNGTNTRDGGQSNNLSSYSSGGSKVDKSILHRFISICENIGFKKVVVDEGRSRFFVILEFVKIDPNHAANNNERKEEEGGKKNKNKRKKNSNDEEEEAIDLGEGFSANPCVYKRR